jgi:hypothetical protein
MVRIALPGLLAVPPVAGPLAPLLGAAALAIPTTLLSLDHALRGGACCTTYVPFVLLCAVLLGPFYASIVAVGAAGLADALFMGPRYQLLEAPMDYFGDTASIISSALIIALVCLFRRLLGQRELARASISPAGVIFSREKGEVWASWNGEEPPICLGAEKRVHLMMEDYLAQVRLAHRLDCRCDPQSSPGAQPSPASS